MELATDTDTELRRAHRRACTDFAARMRLPAWEHLSMPLAEPLAEKNVGDLLEQVTHSNINTAAALSGQQPPPKINLSASEAPALGSDPKAGLGTTAGEGQPTGVVVESIRTVLTVVAGLELSFSPEVRDLLWNRTVELTVLGYDLALAITAGTGLDEVLVDQLVAREDSLGEAFDIWPHLDPRPTDLGTPPAERLLALTGRPTSAWFETAGPDCASGQC